MSARLDPNQKLQDLLRIATLKPQRVFGDQRFTWPQLLSECDSAFTVQASASGTGGMVAWHGDAALFLERHARPGEVRFCRVPAAGAGVDVLARGRIEGPSVVLRVQREGDRFQAACSEDGLNWVRLRRGRSAGAGTGCDRVFRVPLLWRGGPSPPDRRCEAVDAGMIRRQG